MSFIINITQNTEENVNLSIAQKAILINFLDTHNTAKCVIETENREANIVNLNLNKNYNARPKVVSVNSLTPDEAIVINNLFNI